VHKQQLSQETELRDGDIGGSSCLQAFHTGDTDTDVSRLDHADIVRSVPDGEKRGVGASLDKFDNESFLQGRHPA
jgi:hypothetical protein